LTQTNPRRRWLILAVLGTAQLMVVLDVTIVTIALPSAQRALHFANGERQWIVTAYALAFGSLLLLGGRLGDLLGRKWTLVAGLTGFATASGVGGAAQSFGMLAGARACQGAFGALLAPSALSLLATTFTDESERAKAFGVFSALAASGASIGLLLGGLGTQLVSWRFSMYINLVFAVVGVTGAHVLIPGSRPRVRPHLDIPGTFAVCTGLFALVFGCSHAETDGWGSRVTIGMLVTGVALLAVFVLVEARSTHPLLPLRVLASRNRSGSFLAIAIAAIAIFGVLLFLTYYLQQARGYSPTLTGLAFLPMSATIMASAVLGQTKLQAHFGPRSLVTTGMALGAAGMVYLTRIAADSSYSADVLPALVVIGAGMGLVISTSISHATLGVAPQDAGVGSGMVNASQQVGASLGTALLSTIATSATAHALAGSAVNRHAVTAAAIHGYTVGFAWAAAIFAAGAIVSSLVFTRSSRFTSTPIPAAPQRGGRQLKGATR
jgi:EmrB/QacA subfamily drug resistance transporter